MSKAAEVIGDSPMALYRLYDDNGTLLYVGITHSLSTRFGEHAKEKEWWPQVHRKTAAWYANRAEALAAEARAIMDEDPAHNVIRPDDTLGGGRYRGRNKHPLLGWHPKSAEDVAWLRAEAKRRGVTLAVLLDDALAQYRSGCQWMLAGETAPSGPGMAGRA